MAPSGLAREAGYPKTYRFEHLHEWERAVEGILQEAGPIFVDLHVEPGEHYPEDFQRLYAIEYRERFRRALAHA